jgi:hypothetical protein
MVMFPVVMVEPAMAHEIRPMFPVEPVVVVIVIDPVAIMSMPGRIGIVGISGVGRFVDPYIYMHLGAGGVHGQRACYDENHKK